MKIKIEFHYTYLLMMLGFIVTGCIKNVLIITSLILIHELGHFIVAKMVGVKVEKIIIYPYGGVTKLKGKINLSINKELMIAVAGILVQIGYYYLVRKLNFFSEETEYLFSIYHYSLVSFNLLPIFPLDGGRIVNLLLDKFIPFKMANVITIIVSLVVIVVVSSSSLFFIHNYSYVMSLSILGYDLYKFYKELDMIFQRFLLERYLYNFKFYDVKVIKKKENMYKDRKHIIDNKFEDDVLAKMFDNSKYI